jgi:acetyltransferase-like isoleucine patch superfamily enzyme
VRYARLIGVRVGSNCKLIHPNFGTEPYLIEIGDHVELTNNVTFVTHDGGVWVFRDEYPEIDIFGPIVIKDNVFVGLGSIILPNVTIGNNCVIGAGSVVTTSIPDNSVAAGVPAKVLKNIDSYLESSLAKTLNCKNNPAKKRFLVEHFKKEMK